MDSFLEDRTMPHRTTPTRRSKKRGTTVSGPVRLYWALAAQDQMKEALRLAKLADCPMLAGRIRAAIKSAGGAVRHLDNAESRAKRHADKRNMKGLT